MVNVLINACPKYLLLLAPRFSMRKVIVRVLLRFLVPNDIGHIPHNYFTRTESIQPPGCLIHLLTTGVGVGGWGGIIRGVRNHFCAFTVCKCMSHSASRNYINSWANTYISGITTRSVAINISIWSSTWFWLQKYTVIRQFRLLLREVWMVVKGPLQHEHGISSDPIILSDNVLEAA